MTKLPRKSGTAIAAIESEDDVRLGIRALRRKCGVMRRVHDATGMPPLRRNRAGFSGLARIIVGQQLSVASASAIWARCEQVIKPMSAKTIAGLDDEALRSAGLSRPKVRPMRAVSTAVLNGEQQISRLGSHSDADIHAAMTAVPGIGPWTADIFLLACLGRPDAFAAGDLALQVAAQHAFELDQRPSTAELLELAETWRPWRGVSARLLWSYYRVVKNRNSGMPL